MSCRVRPVAFARNTSSIDFFDLDDRRRRRHRRGVVGRHPGRPPGRNLPPVLVVVRLPPLRCRLHIVACRRVVAAKTAGSAAAPPIDAQRLV